MKIMQGELSFCFVFLCSPKKNDVAVGESSSLQPKAGGIKEKSQLILLCSNRLQL